jgi:hypothetical protein
VCLALYQGKASRHRADRQVGAQGVEVCARACRIDRSKTLVELIRAEPARDGVLVELLYEPFALGVRYAYLSGIGHIENVVQMDEAGVRAQLI